MPNHIENRLKIEGPQDAINAMIETFSSTRDNGDRFFPDFEKVLPTSKAAKDSYGTAGAAPRWYTEQIALWGTKWNSYENAQLDGGPNSYSFETAWSTPLPIIAEMSAKFPTLTFHLEFSDEDLGHNCGTKSFLAGQVILSLIPEGGSKRAYDLAFKHRPYRKDEYKLIEGEYVYDEENDN